MGPPICGWSHVVAGVGVGTTIAYTINKMSDILRGVAGLIERFGHFRIRESKAEIEMFLLLAACREYFCPAHKRLVTLAVQVDAINKKRLLMGGLQIKGKRPRAFKEACRGKNVELAQVRGRLFEEMRKEYSALPNVCVVGCGCPGHGGSISKFFKKRDAERFLRRHLGGGIVYLDGDFKTPGVRIISGPRARFHFGW